MWSPFFERTFKSQFSVAKSHVFTIDLDDDGDYELLCAVLKHIYGMPLHIHPQNRLLKWTKVKGLLDHLMRIYKIADKYDFPSARQAVVSFTRDWYQNDELPKLDYDVIRTDQPDLPDQIARVSGPNAPQLADTAMRECLFDWLVYNFGSVGEDPGFKAKLEDGSLLDTDLATKLPLKLSERIRDYILARDIRDDLEAGET